MNRKSTYSTALGALLLSLLAPPSLQLAHAQNAPATTGAGDPMGFAQLSTSKMAPARLQLKSLTKGWQRLTVEDDDNDSYAALYGGFSGQVFQDALTNAGVGVYFTKGQTVTLGSETFLVAYHMDLNMTSQDIQSLFMNLNGHGNDGPAQGPRKFPPDTRLLLSLLNLRTIGSLKDVRPFDAKRDIMGPSDIIEASDANLHSLGRLLLQISQGGYGVQRLPLNDAATLRQAFNRYFHPRQDIFVHPQTKEAYRTNAVLAKTPLRLITNRARVVAIYEARPGTDGKYGAVFLDGHTARVPAGQWASVRAVLPQKPGEQEIRRLSAVNLLQLRASMLRFARVRQDKLPQMTDASILRRQLANYVGDWNASYYTHPVTGEAYRPNPLLSGKTLHQITNQSHLIALYEATPGSDGKRTAIFLDGHLARIAATDWNTARSVPVQTKTSPKPR